MLGVSWVDDQDVRSVSVELTLLKTMICRNRDDINMVRMGLVGLNTMALVGGLQLMLGCAQSPSWTAHPPSAVLIEANLDAPIQLQPQQSARFEETFQVEFLHVSEDSRCPANARCIQSGQVVAAFKLWHPGLHAQTRTLELTLNPAQVPLALQTVGEYTLQLAQVAPYPTAAGVPSALDYTVTIRVSKEP